MKKISIAGIAGGIILFIWSFLAWDKLPLHSPSMHSIPNEDAVADVLKLNIATKGVYLIPAHPGMGADQATMNAWAEKVNRGPNAMIMYDPLGADPMMTSQMVIGIILDILSAMMIAWFLTRSTAVTAPYMARVFYCGMLAVFVSIFTHIMNWNRMGTPSDFTAGLIVDNIIGCLLAGLVIAAIIKPSTTITA